jgi:anti-sigma B factor antagonist
MEIEIKSVNKIKIASIAGDLNSATAPEAENRLTSLIMGGNKKLIIDLEDLNYISSAGLRILLAANKLIKKQNGELRISSINNVVKEVFEISGFNFVFKIYSSADEALVAF